MRIVLVNQFFWPDVAATGQLLTDLARHLAATDDVTVICSAGRYDNVRDSAVAPAVEIIRVPGPKFTRGALGRALSYALFVIGALYHLLTCRKPDVVVTLTTPPLLSLLGTFAKRFRHTRHVIWEMDMFPEVLVSLGAIREESLVCKALAWISNISRKSADAIIALGPCMQQKLIAAGVSPEPIHVAENWADGTTIVPLGSSTAGQMINVFYSGNLGLSHDTSTILAAMRTLRGDSRFAFVFAGGGKSKEELAQHCAAEKLDHVSFASYASRDAMAEHLSKASVGLVTERVESLGTVVPSKVYGLMAAGKPILFIGPNSATPALVVKRFGCGWQIDPGDDGALVSLLQRLADAPGEIELFGARARKALDDHYDTRHGVSRVTQILYSCVSGNNVVQPQENPLFTEAR